MKQLLLFFVLVFYSFSEAHSRPPYDGTIFYFKDVINSKDPSSFQEIVYVGQDNRTMFDRRKNDWISNNAYLFNASYDDGLTIEIQVNSEFTDNKASEYASQYAKVIGQLPTVLRKDVQTVWIHKGDKPFGGGNQNLLIHINQGKKYIADGILEETLVHEASHTSLNWPGSSLDHGKTKGWLAAQKADDEFISTYAKDNPIREDIAESFLTWIVVRHRSDRVSESHVKKILKAIPNRIKYFDEQEFDMYPLVPLE